MIFFKRVSAVFLFGIWIQPAISMEAKEDKQKMSEEKLEHEGKISQDPGNAPHLSFLVVDSTGLPASELTRDSSPVVTGAVKLEEGRWSLALGNTYIRRNTLKETLEANGLAALWEVLKEWDKAAYKHNPNTHQDDLPLFWQVLYMVRKDNASGVTKWLVEGVGFILGPWSSTRKIEIPYIATGQPDRARSCIEHLERESEGKVRFVKVEVNEEQREAVRKAATKHYPRFLCMNDIRVCFSGHSGLSRFAWNTELNRDSGYPANNFLYYGFTLSEGVLSPHTGSLTPFTTLRDKHPHQYNAVESKLRELGFKITLTK